MMVFSLRGAIRFALRFFATYLSSESRWSFSSTSMR